MFNCKVFIRVVEVLLCISCVVALRVTDDESRRVFNYLRNRSREWSLLNNVTWGTIGTAFATATCGGYVIITVGLLIAAATDEIRGRITDRFFLGLGVVLFGIVAGLSLASIENVPHDLVDNAAVLGVLCLLTALVFVADFLIGPKAPKKPEAKQILIEKPHAKTSPTIITLEKEPKSGKIKLPEASGAVNGAFERSDRSKNGQDVQRSTVISEERTVETAGKQTRENSENDAKDERNSDEPRIVLKSQDIYQRPIDEVDTPRFPVNGRHQATFARVVNPSVKIMRVERDVDDTLDAYRYSDSSQYDNVPTRMRGTTMGILKRSRDAMYVESRPQRDTGRRRDEIEMLEEYFDGLKTTTTGTQTGSQMPSSPTDPGYVRHTASNWPVDAKTKTPRHSPDRPRDN